MSVKKGDTAPDFRLPDETGTQVQLYDLLENGPAMLVFYPGDFTPVCTAQLCSYRDNWEQFREFDLQIVGISHDSIGQHGAFSKKHDFPFPLLADPEKRVIKKYAGAGLLSGGRSNRANYIIGTDKSVLYAHKELIPVTRRGSDELLEELRNLREAGAV